MTKKAPPSISEDEEKVRASYRKLGGKRSFRVTCDACQNVYLAGSGHRGSLACQVWAEQRRMRERGFDTVDHYAWTSILCDAGVPVEHANTRPSPYPVEGRKWDDGKYDPIYGNVRSVSAQPWAPLWAARYVRQTIRRDRLFRVEVLKLALRVLEAGHPPHGLPTLFEDLRPFSTTYWPDTNKERRGFQRVLHDGFTYWGAIRPPD